MVIDGHECRKSGAEGGRDDVLLVEVPAEPGPLNPAAWLQPLPFVADPLGEESERQDPRQ